MSCDLVLKFSFGKFYKFWVFFIFVKIKWFGWASFQIEVKNKVIYLDPFFGNYEKRADLVLVSHSHADHCDLDKIEGIRDEDTIVLTSGENVSNISGLGLAPGDFYDFGEIKVTAVDAYNIVGMRSSGVPYHPKGFGVGFLIEVGGKRVYFMGDTESVPEVLNVKGVDVLLLPVGGKYVMNTKEAINLVKKLEPKIVVPMHYGKILYNGNELRLEADLDGFKSGLEGVCDVRVLKHGEYIIV